MHTESRGKLGQAKVEALRTAARQALELWAGDAAIALPDIVEEIKTEIRLLRLAETERARHEQRPTSQTQSPRPPADVNPPTPPS